MIIPLGASRENIEGRVEIQGQSEDRKNGLYSLNKNSHAGYRSSHLPNIFLFLIHTVQNLAMVMEHVLLTIHATTKNVSKLERAWSSPKYRCG